MYLPKSFRQDNRAELHDLMEQNSFATVISTTNGGIEASHLPLLLDRARGPYGTLVGHMARANPQWRSFQAGQEALVIFQGPHAYVSPAWYEVAPSVPTWNYIVAHAYGVPVLIEDPVRLKGILERLVDTHEAQFPRPWRMDLPADYENNMLQAIVGFELEISRLEGKYKLSQNRSENDQQHVAASLLQSSFQPVVAVGEAMQRLKDQ